MFYRISKELYNFAEADYCIWDFREYLPKVVNFSKCRLTVEMF